MHNFRITLVNKHYMGIIPILNSSRKICLLFKCCKRLLFIMNENLKIGTYDYTLYILSMFPCPGTVSSKNTSIRNLFLWMPIKKIYKGFPRKICNSIQVVIYNTHCKYYENHSRKVTIKTKGIYYFHLIQTEYACIKI